MDRALCPEGVLPPLGNALDERLAHGNHGATSSIMSCVTLLQSEGTELNELLQLGLRGIVSKTRVVARARADVLR